MDDCIRAAVACDLKPCPGMSREPVRRSGAFAHRLELTDPGDRRGRPRIERSEQAVAHARRKRNRRVWGSAFEGQELRPGIARMIDPDTSDLAAAIPIRSIQEHERVPLSIDADSEQLVAGSNPGAKAGVQALVVRSNFDGRVLIDSSIDWSEDDDVPPRGSLRAGQGTAPTMSAVATTDPFSSTAANTPRLWAKSV